jgi:hypothetical protein
MNATFVRIVCRLLVASLVFLPLSARAELIGTAQVAASAAAVPASVRDGIEDQLVSHGLAREDARARMAALSDAELVALAGGIENLPAGASGAWAIVIIALLIYFLFAKPAMEGKPAAKK